MNTVDILQLFGILYIIIGLGFLFHSKYYSKIMEEIYESKLVLFFGGIFAFVFGYLIMLYYNDFSFTKEGLVTIIGLIGLLKGLMLLLFPKFVVGFTKNIFKKKYLKFVGSLILLLGAAILYLVYKI